MRRALRKIGSVRTGVIASHPELQQEVFLYKQAVNNAQSVLTLTLFKYTYITFRKGQIITVGFCGAVPGVVSMASHM